MQKLTILRYLYRTDSTSGLVLLDGVFVIFTLELPRSYNGQQNVPTKTCIPTGAYKGKVMSSPKHPEGAPHILGVPGRSAIEMHVANSPKDIEGCCALGMSAAPYTSYVGDSGVAFGKLMQSLPRDFEYDVAVRDVTA